MAAARRWEMGRTRILQGQKPESRHAQALAAVNQTLRDVRFCFSPFIYFSAKCSKTKRGRLQELSEITDNYIINDLRSTDLRAGHWLGDDPTLSTIRSWIRSQS